MIRLTMLTTGVLVALTGSSAGTEQSAITLENVEAPAEISPDEPLRRMFSATLAVRSLDSAALHWQKKRKCGTCHTNFIYLLARPSLNSVSPPSREVRQFFESMVEKRWIEKGPRWDAEVVMTASLLAANDRLTTGKLSPVTRKAYDRMWTLQREDGGWDWLECGWPPMESDAHFGVTLAAISVGMAPENYASSEEAREGVEGIRRYLRENPSPSTHHRAMLLWASTQLPELMKRKEQEVVLEELFSLQRPDGGWATASLIEGWKEHKRKDGEAQELERSDGYGTGFVTFTIRQYGVPAEDARLRKAIDWLSTHQRQSGRWFTPSPTKDSEHFISNAGTAFAVMAIRACLPPGAPMASAESFVGKWALTMSDGAAGWLSIERGSEAWSAELWTVGQPRKITDIEYVDGRLTFVRQCRIGPPRYPGGPPTGRRVPCEFTVTIDGDSIRLQMEGDSESPSDGVRVHVGTRLPPLPLRPDLSKVKFGEPVTLFNGTDLRGWKLSNPRQLNGWKAVDGCLVNETPKQTFDPFSRYGNLRTEALFGDGKLTIEFNVGVDGNSGIYVRGCYEAQVTTRDCKKMQGIRGVGAIFDRIAPTKSAGKPGGEWQTYEITIVDRHATVVLNGERVIDNQPLVGNTNGAFQADVTKPGPLYLQGDHTSVKFRNIVFRPVVSSPESHRPTAE